MSHMNESEQNRVTNVLQERLREAQKTILKRIADVNRWRSNAKTLGVLVLLLFGGLTFHLMCDWDADDSPAELRALVSKMDETIHHYENSNHILVEANLDLVQSFRHTLEHLETCTQVLHAHLDSPAHLGGVFSDYCPSYRYDAVRDLCVYDSREQQRPSRRLKRD